MTLESPLPTDSPDSSAEDARLQTLLAAPSLPRSDVDFVNDVQKAVASRRKSHWFWLPALASLGAAAALLIFWGGVDQGFDVENKDLSVKTSYSSEEKSAVHATSGKHSFLTEVDGEAALLAEASDDEWEEVFVEVEDSSFVALASFSNGSVDDWSADGALGTDEDDELNEDSDFNDDGLELFDDLSSETSGDFSGGQLLAEALTGYGQPEKERTLFDLGFDLDDFSDDELYSLDAALDAS
ncbi:MAG: hypothetical protein GY822_21220 [Deltaproteobacteria bacterium]|nr:hypothetical protein [Deltaproteobacteria bacterium]